MEKIVWAIRAVIFEQFLQIGELSMIKLCHTGFYETI